MNENEILTYLTDQLRLRSAGINNRLQSPQAIQAFREMVLKNNPQLPLNKLGSNIMKGNSALGVGGFIPDMIRLQFGGINPQEQIFNANQYLQKQGSNARINPDGSWSI